LIQIACLK